MIKGGMNMKCKYLHEEKNQCLIIPRHNITKEEKEKYCDAETLKIRADNHKCTIYSTGYYTCPTYKKYKKMYL